MPLEALAEKRREKMKPGMFQTYTEAIAYLVMGAIVTGLIVWGIVEVIGLLR